MNAVIANGNETKKLFKQLFLCVANNTVAKSSSAQLGELSAYISKDMAVNGLARRHNFRRTKEFNENGKLTL